MLSSARHWSHKRWKKKKIDPLWIVAKQLKTFECKILGWRLRKKGDSRCNGFLCAKIYFFYSRFNVECSVTKFINGVVRLHVSLLKRETRLGNRKRRLLELSILLTKTLKLSGKCLRKQNVNIKKKIRTSVIWINITKIKQQRKDKTCFCII